MTVLEEMAGAAMAQIEGHCVTGQQSSHELSRRELARAQEEMEMVVEQGPSEAVGPRRDQQIRKPLEEPAAVVIVVEDGALFDAAHE